jgi:hypothetical protein
LKDRFIESYGCIGLDLAVEHFEYGLVCDLAGWGSTQGNDGVSNMAELMRQLHQYDVTQDGLVNLALPENLLQLPPVDMQANPILLPPLLQS